MNDDGIKSIGEDLHGHEEMSLMVSALVTEGNELMEKPVKSWSDEEVEFGSGYCIYRYIVYIY